MYTCKPRTGYGNVAAPIKFYKSGDAQPWYNLRCINGHVTVAPRGSKLEERACIHSRGGGDCGLGEAMFIKENECTECNTSA